LPRVPFDLNAGWQQNPDEHGGNLRIARTVNCGLESPGKIAKSLGQAAIPATSVPSSVGVTNPLVFGISSLGVPYCLSQQAGSIAYGATVFSADQSSSAETTWALPASTIDRRAVVTDEAPIVRAIFSEENYSYDSPGVIPFGSDFVIVCQGLKSWSGTGAGTFTTVDLQWALVSGEDLRVKARGTYPLTAMAANTRCFPVVAGNYVVCYIDSTVLQVFYFTANPSFGLQLGVNLTGALAVGAGTNNDASWDGSRLLVVGARGEFWLVNPTTWTVTQTGSLGITPVQTGSIGVSRGGSGTTYVAWKLAASDVWKCAVYSITDSNLINVLGATTLHTSPVNLGSHPTAVEWRAGVTAWAAGGVTPSAGAAVVLYQKCVSADGQACTGYIRCFDGTGPITTSYFNMDCFGSFPASKPIVSYTDDSPSTPNFSLWTYQTQQRSIRSAMFLGQTRNVYLDTVTQLYQVYPRLRATAFRGGSTPPTPTESIVGAVNAPVPCYIPSGIPGVQKPGYLTALTAQKRAGSDALNVYLVAQATAGAAHYARDILQPGGAKDATLLSSAVPSQISTKVEMAGAQYQPRNPLVSTYGYGSTPAAGTYIYVAVREWKDANGSVHRSPPTDPMTLVHATNNNILVNVFDDIWQTGTAETITKIYRTKASGTVFYLVTTDTGVPTPVGNGAVAFVDTNTDAQIAANEILYTQGERGGNSGLLETWGAPGCRCIWAGADRAIAGGLEDEFRVRWSNIYYPGEGISWPEDSSFVADVSEPVTAVASLDGIWLVFGKNSVWIITGQGPDAFGIGGFDTPRKISTGVGALSWRSLVETPLGIFFQAPSGQIYLVQRGTFQVQMISQAIQDAIARDPEVPSTPSVQGFINEAEPWNYVMGATFDSQTQEVWLSELTGRDWVYSIDKGAWRSEINTANVGKQAFSGGLTRVVKLNADTNEYNTYEGPAIVRGTLASATIASFGYRLKRKTDRYPYRDRSDNARTMALWTSDIDFWHGRLRKVWLRLTRERVIPSPTVAIADNPVTLPYSMGFWFDGKRADQIADETQVFIKDLGADAYQFLEVECSPARQKCNQMRFCWWDTPALTPDVTWSVVGLSIEAEGAQTGRGPIRNASGSGRMT
jgi:hypothetical protein